MAWVFFLLSIFVIPGLPMGATVGRWALLSVVCAWLLFSVEIPFIAWLLLTYVALMGFAAPVGYEAIYLYWHFLLMVVLFYYAPRLDMRSVAIALGAGFTINSFAVIAQYFGWQGIPEIAPMSGLYFNRNMASEAAGMAFALVIGYQLWWLALGILPTLAVGARSALVALGVAGFLVLWRRSRFAALLAVLVGAGAAIYKSGLNFGTMDMRLEAWRDMLPGLTWFGRGLGSFIIEFPRWQVHTNTLWFRWEHPHNDFFQIVFEFGIFGALLAVIFLARFAAASRSPAWYALLVFLVEGLFGYPLYEPVTAALAAVCAGLVLDGSDSLRLLFVWQRLRVWLGNADTKLAGVRARGEAVSVGAGPS